MNVMKYVEPVLAMGIALLFFTGCSSFQVVNKRAVTVDEVIRMSRAGVGTDVIIRHLEATWSKYKLTTDDIVRLTEEGVDDDVIEVMVESGTLPDRFSWETGYYPYQNWGNYYDYYGYYGNYYGYRYHYPYYSTYNPYMYMSPYVVYRDPGLVGRFYRYAPVQGYPRPYTDYYHRKSKEQYDEPDNKENR